MSDCEHKWEISARYYDSWNSVGHCQVKGCKAVLYGQELVDLTNAHIKRGEVLEDVLDEAREATETWMAYLLSEKETDLTEKHAFVMGALWVTVRGATEEPTDERGIL